MCVFCLCVFGEGEARGGRGLGLKELLRKRFHSGVPLALPDCDQGCVEGCIRFGALLSLAFFAGFDGIM